MVEHRAIGIDIGAHSITICTAKDGTPAKTWQTVTLDLSNPDWYIALGALIGAGSIITVEPTGLYYARPIVQECQRHGATVFYVTHTTTAATRADRVTTQKTDANDARALAVKALDILRNGWTHGAYTDHPETRDLTLVLRLALRARINAQKEAVLYTNRLGTLARGIWPALAKHKATYLKAIEYGATTPAQIHTLADLARPNGMHGSTHAALKRLALELPPHIPEPPDRLIAAIRHCTAQIARAKAQIAELDADLRTLLAHDLTAHTVALWLTVPASSIPKIATLLAATYCEPERYDADAFKAAVGCHPLRHESGTMNETRATKRGYKPAKAALHIWTLQLLHPTAPANPIRDYWQRLHNRHNRAAVHAARGKLARILNGIARSGTPYHYAPPSDGIIEQTFYDTAPLEATPIDKDEWE